MNYSLGYTLGRTSVFSRGDADALAYIAAVEGTGTSVSATQKTAINDFYVAAKADSYYTSLKRLYLPIWGSAAANAIDMISLTSGTFNGGVTHGAGFVQGNGTTGYFAVGANATSVGLTQNSNGLMALTNLAHSNTGTVGFGGGGGGGADIILQGDGAGAYYFGNEPSYDAPFVSGTDGILIGSRRGASILEITRRKTSGVTTGVDLTNTSTALSSNNITFMARGDISLFHDGRFGAFGLHTGITLATASTYSLALKNLWETCTGNVLP